MAKNTRDYAVEVRYKKNGPWDDMDYDMTKKQALKMLREVVRYAKDGGHGYSNIKEARRVRILSIPIGKTWKRGK